MGSINEAFQKISGETIFELEIYPKFIYFLKVNDKGEKLHRQAIVNQIIDKKYMKKVLKSNQIPFYELYVSKKISFEGLLREISVVLKENPLKGRLWIEDEIVSGRRLNITLEDFGIS